MTTQYIAQIFNKRRRLYISKPHDTREAAAREAFIACPKYKLCSTGYGYAGGFDIHWHRREDIRLYPDSDPGYVDPGELAEDRWNETHGDRW